MYCFNNDYSEGAHPQIMKALIESALEQNSGYGTDAHCQAARTLIQNECGQKDADVHFITGGTQTNLIVISAALRPHQAVITAHTGHINVHETGAIEATGHKVLTQYAKDGKLTPELIQKSLDEHETEHMVQPKMVYLSNSTELGTQYSLDELQAVSRFCKTNNLYLFLDGARLGAALTSPVNDLTMKDIAALTDVFYIGGTKNGLLFGEALVISHPGLKPDFRFYMKQKGALLAKGFLLGTQFEQLFKNQLFYELAAHANAMAAKLKKGFAECGYSFYSDSSTNQLFPILPNVLIGKLRQHYQFQDEAAVDGAASAVRFVTSWASKENEIEQFIRELKTLSAAPDPIA